VADEDHVPHGNVTNREISAQVSGVRERLDMIWEGHKTEHKVHDDNHKREHEFAQKAIDTAAALAKENKADANEWRATMNDREVKFATKDDVKPVLERLDRIERALLVSDERERNRITEEANEKRDAERRVSRSQWAIGLTVGLMATVGAVLINLVLRLTGAA
jgi:hypothetical protein